MMFSKALLACLVIISIDGVLSTGGGNSEKPGVCPRARSSDYDKKAECTSDAGCPGNQKCCAEGYGRVCKPPITPVDCSKSDCKAQTCAKKYTPYGKCCPTCKEDYDYKYCMLGDRKYKDDQNVPCSDPCKICTCKGGKVNCQRRACPRPDCYDSYVPTGKCCPVCKEADLRCIVNGTKYENGASVPDDNPCLVCTCNKGNVECIKKDCAKPTCEYPYTPAGECCPVCNNGCVINGVSYEEGEEVLADDPCDICTCSQGDVDCMPRACDPLTCTNTYVPYGECCPVCKKGCTLNGVNYNEGDTVPDDNPCAKCKCTNGDVTCSYTNCTNPNCDNSFTPKGECCPKCVEGCEMNGVTYKEGQTVPDENPCANCVCRNGLVRCNYTTCATLTCANKVKPAGKCCPECREGCVRNGKTYKEGEKVPDDNPCASCTCQKGDVTCTYTTCTALTCKDQFRPQGECCAKCREGCVVNGKTYKEGESVPDDNPCATCTCKGGEVECTYKTCVALPCANTYIPSGACCPVCKEGCSVGGKDYKEGEKVPDNDVCKDCTCKNADAVCKYKFCSPLTCDLTYQPENECCPKCKTGCVMNGTSYAEGAPVPDSNPCATCTCQQGAVVCTYKPCDPLTCNDQYVPAGECCAKCQTDCVKNGKTYKDGENVPDDNPCATCTCKSGDVTCTYTACTKLTCVDQYVPPGKCCPVCREGCTMNGTTYKEGDPVPNPNPCAKCVCRDGDVDCTYDTCVIPTCANTFTPQGKCCPVCVDYCMKDGKRYEDGADVPDDDPCTNCTCKNGEIKCTCKLCERLTCKRVYTPTGECCPVCVNGCSVNGTNYKEQDKVPSTDPCQTCTCVNGMVLCTFTSCSVPLCENKYKPAGQCCPECVKECLVDGKTYKEGETVPDNNPCATCTCKNGAVECTYKACNVLNCKNQVRKPGQCCAECKQECEFEGKTYKENENVPNADPCATCTCENGHVNCKYAQCAALSCLNTHTPKGKCCPECRTGCVMDGKTYKEDEVVPNSDPCAECKCRQGAVRCSFKTCNKLTCENVYKPPGECCPQCLTTCTVNGTTYKNGDKVPNSNPCASCTCDNGQVTCTVTKCTALLCEDQYRPEGQCCCICREGCERDGKKYKDGDTVPDSNPCAKCTCTKSGVRCYYDRCTNLTCPHQTKPDDKCCATCVNECEMDGKKYTEGQSVPSSNPCAKCTCRSGSVDCVITTCEPLACSNTVQPADKCCPVCVKECVVNGTKYKEGDKVPHPNPCADCKCRDGGVDCVFKPCPIPKCKYTFTPSGECCPKCREGCVMNGKTYKEGQSVPSANPCATCVCENGEVTCDYKNCTQLSCDDQLRPEGQCCAACAEGCEKDGKKYKEGESIPGNNACESCKCTQGKVVCTYTSCQTLTCTNKVTTPGKCCPDCVQVCKMNGKDYKEGENVPSDDPCQTCTCRNGDIDCVYNVCVPPKCPNTYTPKGKCCPECVQGCTMDGKTYKDGEAVPTKDPCANCTCNNGDVDCDYTACAPPPCDISYTPAAKCCPVCRTDCVRNGKTYKDGESVPDDNPCATCKCVKGVVKCGYKDCPPLTCAASYKPKGECCAKCKEGCEKNGQKYEHGQTVPDSDPCKTCRCLSGEVKCDTISCPKLSCYDTYKPAGRCCPRCKESCTRDGKTYEHGKPVPDADPCRNCTCDNGRVKCDIVVCPILNCYVTVPQPGKCCPICKEYNKCKTTGQYAAEYKHGYNTPSEDPCKYCTCVDGKMECEDYACPKLTCGEYERIKPKGKCCQVCKEKKPCNKGPYGKDYDDGDYVPDYKPCKKCRCNYGNIECEDSKYGC